MKSLNKSTGGKQKGKTGINLKPIADVSRGKRMMLSLIMFAIIVGCFGMSYFLTTLQQDEITVVRLKNTKVAGDLLLESDVEKLSMPMSFYEDYGVAKFKENGKEVTKQTIVQWKDKDDILNKYMVNYTISGTYLTSRHVTDELVLKNPWTQNIPESSEVYTLPFSASDVNTNMLMIGTDLRVRAVTQVPASQAAALKAQIAEKEAAMANGTYVADGTSLVIDAMQDYGLSGQVGFGESLAESAIPVSEVIFDRITIVDMLNGSGESIFELYIDLLKKPVDERIPYLETTIEGSNTDFKSKVTPTSLVLVVNRAEASRLAEFENLGATMKYTILPDTKNDFSLMNQFVEISNQINSFIQNSPGQSFN